MWKQQRKVEIYGSFDSTSSNEEKMALASKRFTKVFQSKKNFSNGTIRDSLIKKYLRPINKVDDSNDEANKHHSKSHIY